MRTLPWCMVMIGVTLNSGVAQTSAKRKKGAPAPRPSGTVRLYVHPEPPEPGQEPGLQGWCNRSSLIIQGVVRKTLFPRASGTSLETDAVVSVKRTLKGPANVRELLISQPGGITGEFNSIPVDYSLVQPGEECLLFLTEEDKRPNIPAVPGLKRYLIAGIYSGLFQFEAGKMRVKADSPDHFRKKYEGLTIEQVISEVSAACPI